MKAAYYLIRASFGKEIRELIRYKFNTLTNIFTLYILFMAMFHGVRFFGNTMEVATALLDESLESFVVGYFLWTIMYMGYQDVAYSITRDSSTGTLEQISMSSIGLEAVLVTRSLVNILINTAICFIVLFVMMESTGYWLEGNIVSVIVPIFLGIFSILGIGMIFGGLAIIFKKINAIINIVQYFLIALVFPTEIGNELISNLLIPFRPSINNVYGIILGKISLVDLRLIDYLLMIGNSLIYFSIGLFIFKGCIQIAKKKGLMGQY